ncbi:hypothetical protein DL769_008563 [Monosporascus sp. CRB-8-3]|nr:hypothetical protein DL769_008563 [Monosporascus sp. CRB-8-3]
MVDSAGYPIERQFEALLFHFHWIVPYLGPQPGAGGIAMWQSLLGAEGSPIEYSWKWNTPGGEPEVRYCIEAINEFTGTSLDPLNQLANRELLYRLEAVVPSLDLTWVNHFIATLYDHDNSNMLAVDDVEPASSRLKLYFQTQRTSFSSVREIMTLGGLIPVPEASLSNLRDLIISAVGLPDDFPDDAELPCPDYNPAAKDNFIDIPILLQGSLYYFDLAPGATIPDIKYYASARRYARSDLSWARGVASWMKSRGRGAYCDRYLGLLESFAQHRSLDEGTGIQAYLSCLFRKDGELDITSYLSPEAFHPSRQRSSGVS